MKFSWVGHKDGVDLHIEESRIDKVLRAVRLILPLLVGSVSIFQLVNPSDQGNQIDLTEETEEAFLLDRNADLPEIYTGELVDLDGDKSADIALFGDPADPTVKDLKAESFDRTPIYVALLGVSGVVLGASLGPVATAYAKRRWGVTGDDD